MMMVVVMVGLDMYTTSIVGVGIAWSCVSDCLVFGVELHGE